MTDDVLTIGLAELAAGRVGTVEAVTIVREIANRITAGTLPGVPSPQVIRLTPSGTIFIEGPIAADARTVAHAAYLLETLLPHPDVKTHDRVPGALRLIVGRALRTLDLPPYTSLADFADALARFAAPDATLCIQALVLSRTLDPAGTDLLPVAINAGDTEAVTISDIRRARRATGLTLTEISDRTGIPVPLLCELEWGYLHHWPAPVAARRLLLRYARATGLDDELVVRTVWPILEDEARDRERKTSYAPIVETVPVDESGEVGTVHIARAIASPVVAHSPRTTRKPRRRAIAVAALAIPALFVIGIAPVAREYLAARRHQPSHVTVVTDGRSDNLANTPPVLDTASAPSVRPVAISNSVALSPAFASSGSAVFHATASAAARRTETHDRSAVLRVISIVDDRSHNFHARLSPDGRQIAFDSDRDGLRGVYVADRNGQQVRRVSGDGFAAIPTWSPDGRTLAVVRAEPDQPQVWNLWEIDLSNGQGKRLTSHEVGQSWGGSWFPDGQKIAYSHEGRVVVLNLSNGSTRTYPPPRAAEAIGIPAVSPDGRRALFQVAGDGSWLLDFRSGVMKKILSDPSAEAYSWSPDGRRVAYHSRATDVWGVWIMPPSR